MVSKFRFELVKAYRLGLTNGAEDIRFLMQENSTAAWKQLRLSQISIGAALHAPLDEIGTIPQAAQYRCVSVLKFYLFVLFFTSQAQAMTAQTVSLASLCDTAFELLLGGKYQFVSSVVSWPN